MDYATYHLLQEPETTIEVMQLGLGPTKTKTIQFWRDSLYILYSSFCSELFQHLWDCCNTNHVELADHIHLLNIVLICYALFSWIFEPWIMAKKKPQAYFGTTIFSPGTLTSLMAWFTWKSHHLQRKTMWNIRTNLHHMVFQPLIFRF